MGKKKISPEEQVSEYARSIVMSIEKWKSHAENGCARSFLCVSRKIFPSQRNCICRFHRKQTMIRRYRNNPRNTAPLAVILCFETGVRIGELVCIKMSDIHGNYIRIQRQEVRDFAYVSETQMTFNGFRVVEYTKSSDEYRDVYLTETAKYIINFVQQVNELYGNKYDDYLFVFGKKRINHYGIQTQILRGCKHIMIPTKTAHKIRKTYISALIECRSKY